MLVIFAATVLLYQTNVRGDRPPAFGRGGAFAGSLTNPGILEGDQDIPSPTPLPTGISRSSATISVAATPKPGAGGVDGTFPFPTFAKYVYAVEGYETATAFGQRDYPSEMTTTVHRTQPTEPDVPRVRDDEVIFDLYFSDSHEEREIVAFRDDSIVFTYEAGSVTFGPATRTSEATYEPPMLQIPIPLKEGAQVTGMTRAKDSNGNVTRTEDWTVTVQGRDEIPVMREQTPVWIVKIDRQSRPGSSERVTRSRTYWFDPQRSIWVKWQETLNGSQDFGPGDFNYRTEFTATLSRMERL